MADSVAMLAWRTAQKPRRGTPRIGSITQAGGPMGYGGPSRIVVGGLDPESAARQSEAEGSYNPYKIDRG